jgi:hypothetical protein
VRSGAGTLPQNKAPKGPREKALKLVSGLDLGHQTDADSFAALVGQKKPASNFELNALAIYYLAEKKKITNINRDHVFTCYNALDQDPHRVRSKPAGHQR